MSELLLSAVLGSFFMARLFRGSWLRNPQYLAASIAGSVAGSLLLHAFWPALDGDFIAGAIIGVAGPYAGMTLFDLLLKSA
ncbi:hypothetical protein [Manganibacter manganicus]|uniref:Uncharacterized protein n=1 Tax=Manganibacter manganicus TaxID=1873176 RepID=A0A1V8RWA6_9HYPH|nr:hypothetical protein [Pseudaminobacter manganicus]OQM77480.1 hypothetical protein BFN67_01165 [Pseudaminobacter manganicus]